MKIVQFGASDGLRVGIVDGEAIVDLFDAAVAWGVDSRPFRSTLQLLQHGDTAMRLASTLTGAGAPAAARIPLASAKLAAPVFPGKIVAVGLNYRDHAAETKAKIPEAPLCFAKFTSSVSGPYDDIVLPAEDAQVDFEGELGVVIGRDARHIAESDACSYIAGYVVFNDVSERKWQFADQQWTRGKSCDSFAPFGPWLITADEVPAPSSLAIATRVNGETMQDSNTSQLIFSIPKLLSYFSHSFSLQAGDVIATGTPAGVGVFRNPQCFLQAGDVVEVEIEGVGRIRNRVVASRPSRG